MGYSICTIIRSVLEPRGRVDILNGIRRKVIKLIKRVHCDEDKDEDEVVLLTRRKS